MTIKTLRLLAAATMLLSLASCDNDENYDPLANGPVQMSFTADINGVATRATATGFETGDAVGIIPVKGGNVETAQANIAYTRGSTGFSATTPYYFQERGNVTFNAYYPYAANLAGNYGITIDTRSVNQSIETVNGHDWRKNDYLFASAETNVKAPTISFTGAKAFNHVMSSIAFKFKAGTANGVASVKGLSGYFIGDFVMDGTFNCSTGAVTLKKGAAAEPIAFSEYCLVEAAEYTTNPLILLPQVVDGGQISLVVYFNNEEYTAKLKLAELVAGTRYEFPVTIKNTGLEIGNAEIIDWSTGSSSEGDAILQ